MKLYPYPEPKLHLRRRATSRGRAEIYWDHHTRVIRNMGRNALRRIHEVYKATNGFPTVDELEIWISDHHPRARHDFDDSEKMAFDAAVFALDAFDIAEYAKRVERARNGGKVSGHKKGARGVRTPKYGPADLPEGQSIAEQAKALGVSKETISRIRREKKVQETEALLAMMTPAQDEAAQDSIPETKAPDESWSRFSYLLDPDAVAPTGASVEEVALPAPIDIRTRRPVGMDAQPAPRREAMGL